MKLYSAVTANRIGRRAVASAVTMALMTMTATAYAATFAPSSTTSGISASDSVQQPAAGTNLALNQPVTASDVENPIAFKANNVNDGDTTTRWSSGFTDDQWIAVDLGSVQSVGKVVLNWENAYATDYLIEVSIDGQTWQTADENPAGTGGIETRVFPAVSARYVRMHGVKRATGYGYSLWELGVYAPDATGTAPPGSGSNDPSEGFNYQVYPGFIGTQLRNVTNGQWRDDQIYVEILARNPNKKDAANQDAMSYITPDGTLVALKEEDNNGPGHLTKNGQNYPNYAFTLAQAKLLKLPESESGRIFVSFGEPMYMSVVKGADGSIGFAGPNPLNGTDPNVGLYYDWYEYTWNDNALFINTTQVDQFSIPLALDVYGGNKTRHLNSGITQTRAQVLQEYNTEVPVEFQLADTNPVRILAPGKDAFDTGKPQEHYFDAYIDEAWTYYQTHTLTINRGAEQYVGTVVNDVLVFQHVNWAQTPNAGEPEGFQFQVFKPTTQDVLEGKGNLARASDGDVWGVTPQLEAQICAAFNRHVMEDTTLWKNASAFYQQAPANYYSRFWHVHGVNGKAYGFAYDDVSDQSSTLIESQPEHLELGIGW